MSCCPEEISENTPFWRRIDKIFLSLFLVIAGFYFYALFQLTFIPFEIFSHYAHTVLNYIHQIYWGILLGIGFVALIQLIPQAVIMRMLSSKSNFRAIAKATLAGVILDLCNHGILLIAMKLYQKGVRTSQIIAFLVASPWNSFSLLFILWALIGWQWTLVYLLLSVVVAFSAGMLYEYAIGKKILPENPYLAPQNHLSFREAFRQEFEHTDFNLKFFTKLLWNSFYESQAILRWLLIGILVAASLANFIPTDYFQALFGPTLVGLLVTIMAATVIEVCSEGSVPIAYEIFTKGNAPGNSFVFLMAGASTDYMEIMALKETTKSWKIALFLPLFTLPQILLLGWLLNFF